MAGKPGTGTRQRAAKARTWDRLTDLLWDAAEAGNVPAMRILRQEMRLERDETPEIESVVDELAGKRRQKAASG